MILHGLIQRDDWEEIRAMLANDTTSRLVLAELGRRDPLARTPLHYASAERSAPADLVAALLERAPARVVQSVDVGGNSLLHMAAATENSSVLRVLLEKLASTSTQWLTTRQNENDNGLTPVQMAWKKYLHPSFAFFDRGDSQGGNRNSSSGMQLPPITEKQKLHLHLLTSVSRFSELSSPAAGCASASLLDLWNKTIVLCSATAHSDMEYPIFGGSGCTWNPLHALIQHGGNRSLQCPSIAVWLSLHLCNATNDKQQLTHPVDDKGNLLLHIAVSRPACPILSLSPNVAKQLELMHPSFSAYASRSVVAQLTHLNSTTAACRNHAGRLALHLAISHGKPWRDGIDVLLQAHPAAMEETDPVTDLVPLLQTAASPQCSLTVVWEMLRCRPAHWLPPPRRQQQSQRQQRPATPIRQSERAPCTRKRQCTTNQEVSRVHRSAVRRKVTLQTR
jgi:hypothetical protein